ncbi:MAG: tRNA-dihydrouridine(20/20a) synthase [Chroococcopsis gigantea SAG 12.99]|nr:tRNA dihydrouridine(20/20a) synthase DusA [Chlorogloea purpurea SAG 13.99]MDV3000121.1 tRNA-dihydrouridine(20/20a) synthase [Chroococcopsis gigantea SAG 12.99]
MTIPAYVLSVAPMMDYTDRHFRYFLRLITKHTLLYTEMITALAILHGDRDKLLGFSIEEKPLSLQLGGDNPQHLALCAKIAQDMGYDEVNLNVGCPSSRVKDGNFGACLMAKPERVAEAIALMRESVSIPVTVKHRIGIDDRDSYEDMLDFVTTVSQSGCRRFIVHARKAWLQGLNPKENRTIPPLRYEDVYRLKRELPHLEIEINGGILTLEAADKHLTFVDGVMIGRAAYDNPYLFASADNIFYADTSIPLSREEVVEKMLPYIESWLGKGYRLHSISRHLLQLFSGQPGAKAWKRYLSENVHPAGAGVEVIKEALRMRREFFDRGNSFNDDHDTSVGMVNNII